ncbi:MAG TPA: type II toxin-antitoxin system prevent-host-death family antitoxin [Terriglobia bacterium]|nr:type II toxin-antitoxin system prevent-host-death family antitoxin [Terriglobia bacterium]
MESIRLLEGKTRLSALLERVALGEEITITKRGHTVARLVPMERRGKSDPKQVAEAIGLCAKASSLKVSLGARHRRGLFGVSFFCGLYLCVVHTCR